VLKDLRGLKGLNVSRKKPSTGKGPATRVAGSGGTQATEKGQAEKAASKPANDHREI